MSPSEKVTQYMNEHSIVPRVEEAINKAVLKKSNNPLAEVGLALLAGDSAPEVPRPLSLPKQVAKAGGVREEARLARLALDREDWQLRVDARCARGAEQTRA